MYPIRTVQRFYQPVLIAVNNSRVSFLQEADAALKGPLNETLTLLGAGQVTTQATWALAPIYNVSDAVSCLPHAPSAAVWQVLGSNISYCFRES